MTISTAPHSRLDSRPGRRPRRAEDVEDPGKKPKKVNSEARKQQNRIASRNYRTSYLRCIGNSICRVNILFCAGEKRKQKLQYLQQLIRDRSNDEQTPEPSPRQHEAHLRSLCADYDTGASSSPYMLPASEDFTPTNSSSAAAHCQAPTSHHLLPTTQSYPPFQQHWNSPIHDPIPPPNMSYMPNWVPSMDYSSRLDARPESFQFLPSLGIPAFDNDPVHTTTHANSYQMPAITTLADLMGISMSLKAIRCSLLKQYTTSFCPLSSSCSTHRQRCLLRLAGRASRHVDPRVWPHSACPSVCCARDQYARGQLAFPHWRRRHGEQNNREPRRWLNSVE
jgi:hypothetical protein